MRKVFLEGLPKRGSQIDWINSVGCRVKFEYDNINGELEIIDYDKINRKLTLKYNNNIHKIHTNGFRRVALGSLLDIVNYKYIFNVGDIVTNNYSSVLITQKTRTKKQSRKQYKYRCLNCGYEGSKVEASFEANSGCPVCAGKKVLQGINDIPTTDPWMTAYFQGGYDEAKLYSKGSGKKIYPLCPICNKVSNKPVLISNIHKRKHHAFSCMCRDGVSFGEKFMNEFLQQLGLEYEYRKSDFLWSEGKEYDFYIPSMDCIIEVHGSQHYDNSFSSIDGARTLNEERENDKYKKALAMQNNIKEYIVIDCRESTGEHIKNSILKSRLSQIIKINKVDWDKCLEKACTSRIKEACEIKNHNPEYISSQIGDILGLSKSTIIKYLKIGNSLGWCNYNVDEEIKKKGLRFMSNNHPMSKKIICTTTGKLFNTQREASDYYKIKSVNHISSCCSNKRKYCGKHPETGEELRWMYYEDYIAQHN